MIDKYEFRAHFDMLKYTGVSTVRNVKTATSGARMTVQTQSSSSTTWDIDILEKLRQIIRTSSKNFDEIFREFDQDKNGFIS
jgi:2-phospho-L-lactate guanylyltransferase (CobY/MobA/RfbA family)